MKRYTYYYCLLIFSLFILLPGMTSCADEWAEQQTGKRPMDVVEGLEGTLSLSFSSYDFESKTTSLTRASSDAEDDEQHLHSIYVFVINMANEDNGPANCPILARKFFSDITGKLESVTENGTAWNVIDLQMKAISCNKAAILAIANLGYSEMQHVENDSQLLNRCDSISTLEELNELTARLSAEDGLVNVERMQGHYLMSGFYADFSSKDNLHYLQSNPLRIALNAESDGTLSLWDSSDNTKQFRPLGTTDTGKTPGAIILHRLDSKVTFNIRPGGELKNTKGAYFRLTSWQVKNVPTQERIHWYDTEEPHSHTVKDSKVFQRDITETADSAWTFTFYQFENCSTERANGATDNSNGYRLIDANGIAEQYNMEYALTGERTISRTTVTSAFSEYPNGYSQFAYTLRDLNEKEGYEPEADNNGEAYVTNGGFSYAPKNATYVVLKGEYYNPEEPVRRRPDDERNELYPDKSLAAYPYWSVANVPVATLGEAAKRTRTANVIYYIHLGYVGGGNINRTLDEVPASITTFEQFGEKVNDYNILRNHHYTYTITVTGVNNIKVEATREDGGNIYEQEKQTGAEGAVVESQHFFNLDAHYETRNVTIDFERMPQNYTGYGFLLSTPYDYVQAKIRQKEDETFEVINNLTGNAITDIRGLDLDWIHFAWHGTDANPNRSLINETTGNGISYSETYGGYTTQQTYNDTEGKLRHDKDTEHPYYLMNSAEFIKHVWDQYQSWMAAGRPDAQKTRTYTIYVDEFYYDNNPVSGSNVNWTSFCNRSPRQVFFFMEDKEISADQHSTYVDAHIVISQQSIQTPYATSTAGGQVIADVAFGIEHLDEFQAKYNRSESDEHGFASGATRQNGLYNAMLWFKNNNTTTWEEAESYYTDNARIYVPKQADYLSENGDDKGRENRKGALAVFSRNRDLNRDGKLDANEIRWFVPALDQYMVCFLGGRPAFENPIYESSRAIKTDEKNTTIEDYLRGTPIQHYITSTSGKQRIYWAEEGCAYGNYGASKDWGCYGIRMARMLRQNGLDDTGSAFTTLNKNLLVQDPIFIVSKSRNGQAITYKSDELVYGENYYITLNKLNTNAFRDYVASGDLAQHTHEQKNNWLYREYKIAKNKIGYTSWTDDTYDRTPKIDGEPRTWWQLNGVWTNTGEAATYYNNQAGLFYAGTTTTLAYEYTESGNGDDLHRWRVPNLREMAIMNMAFPAAWFNCSASGSSYCTRTRSDNLGPKYYTGSQGKRIPYFRVTDNDITRIPNWSNSGFQYIRPIHDIR